MPCFPEVCEAGRHHLRRDEGNYARKVIHRYTFEKVQTDWTSFVIAVMTGVVLPRTCVAYLSRCTQVLYMSVWYLLAPKLKHVIYLNGQIFYLLASLVLVCG